MAVAGESLVDQIHRQDGSVASCLGGAPYNLARALARQGLATVYLNPLSSDPLGRELAKTLLEDGVLLAQPLAVENPTSLARVHLDAAGRPHYAFHRDGAADRQVSLDGLTHSCAQQAGLRLVCTGGLALDARDASVYLPWLRAQRKLGRYVAIDANLRPSAMPDPDAYRRHVMTALGEANILKLSDEDMRNLGFAADGEAALLRYAQALLEQSGVSLLALTLGSDGAWLLTRRGQWFAREALPLSVVDTVGAGDCFFAGLLAALLALRPADMELDAMDGPQVLRHALACASLSVQRRGCQPADWDEAIAWSRAHPATAR